MSEQAHVHSHEVLAPRPVERAATWLSLACAAHCLAMPLLSAVPALFASQFAAAQLTSHGSGLDTALTIFVVVSVLVSGAFGFARHRDVRVLVGMGIGLCLYLLGHELEESAAGLPLSVLGALCLAATSYFSGRLAQRCAHDHGPSCDHAH